MNRLWHGIPSQGLWKAAQEATSGRSQSAPSQKGAAPNSDRKCQESRKYLCLKQEELPSSGEICHHEIEAAINSVCAVHSVTPRKPQRRRADDGRAAARHAQALADAGATHLSG